MLHWCLAAEMLAESIRCCFCSKCSYFCSPCHYFQVLSQPYSRDQCSWLWGVSFHSLETVGVADGQDWRQGWVDPWPAPTWQFTVSFIFRVHINITPMQIPRAFHPALQGSAVLCWWTSCQCTQRMAEIWKFSSCFCEFKQLPVLWKAEMPSTLLPAFPI